MFLSELWLSLAGVNLSRAPEITLGWRRVSPSREFPHSCWFHSRISPYLPVWLYQLESLKNSPLCKDFNTAWPWGLHSSPWIVLCGRSGMLLLHPVSSRFLPATSILQSFYPHSSPYNISPYCKSSLKAKTPPNQTKMKKTAEKVTLHKRTAQGS